MKIIGEALLVRSHNNIKYFLKTYGEKILIQFETMATSLTNTRNALAQIMTKIASLESQGAGTGRVSFK
jgi:hypothetical protein